MYNGIGLATARGSGTNGYVTRNWAAVKKVKDQTPFKTEEELSKIDSAANRQPNQELLDHDRKRKVELKCIELEQSLEDQGFSQDEITEKINTFRTTLLGKQKSGAEYDEFGRPIVKDTHQYADEQLKKNARLRDAFGISEFFIEGSSLDPERKIKEAALAQLKALQVEQTVAQIQMNDDTSTNKDSSITNELQSKSPKHKKRKKKKSKSHKTDKEKGSDKKKSKKHKKKHLSSSEDSTRYEETKINKNSLQIKSKFDFDKSNKVITEHSKKKYDSENSHKKHLRDDDKIYKNDKKEVESRYKSDREENRRKDSKSDTYKNSKKEKITEEFNKSKHRDIVHEPKKQDNSPRHLKSPIKERERDRAKDNDKYSYRHQKSCDNSKSSKEKYDKKSDKADSKYNSKKRNESPVKEFKKPIVQPEKLTCVTSGSDSEKSCYTPPPKDMNVTYAKLVKPKNNEDKNVKGTKYTFSLREHGEDPLVVTKANGRTNNLKLSSQNNEIQHKIVDSQKTNNRVEKIFLDSSSSEAGELDGDIDLNIIKEITTEKIKKVFELHEKQEQALLHLKKKLMEKKRKVRTSSSSSETSEEEPVKKKSVKRRRVRDSSSSISDSRKKSKRSRSHSRSRSSSSSSSASGTSIDRHKSSSKRRSSDKYTKKKSPFTRRRTKGSTSRSVSISSIDRSRKKRISSSEESSPRRKRKSSKHKRLSRRERSSDSSSSSSRSSSSYKKKRRYSSSRSRSTSSSSSSHYSRSSSSSHDSTSSVSSRSSKSRSASIPRRRGSPSFLDRRRITSARKRPIPYTRLTPFSTNSDTDSVISVHDSPYAESH